MEKSWADRDELITLGPPSGYIHALGLCFMRKLSVPVTVHISACPPVPVSTGLYLRALGGTLCELSPALRLVNPCLGARVWGYMFSGEHHLSLLWTCCQAGPSCAWLPLLIPTLSEALSQSPPSPSSGLGPAQNHLNRQFSVP